MPDLTIRYSYAGVPTIKAFSDSDAFMRGLMGPFGSGKSSGCVIDLVKRANGQKPSPDGIKYRRTAVIRNTYPQLRDTTIKTFKDWLPPHAFGTWKESEHTYVIDRIPNLHWEVMFRALDRPEHIANLLSLELSDAWVNEAREIPYSIIKALRGRVGRYPRKEHGGPTWYGIIADTNPPETDSWWYNLFEEERPDNVAIFRQPSGRSAQAENLANLPTGYYTNLAQGMDTEWCKVYVEGEYGFVVDGKPVYPDYVDSLHCAQLEAVKGIALQRGWDFGLTPSIVIGQLLPSGYFNVLDEMTSDNMGVDRFSDDVLDYCSRHYAGYGFEDYGDPAGNTPSQTDERTCFEILRGKGIDIQSGEQSPTIRIESVKKPLNTITLGRPMMQINPLCKVLRRGFQGGYQYRRMQTSKERFADKPDKNRYSHVHDALQYICTRLFAASVKRSDSQTLDYHALYG